MKSRLPLGFAMCLAAASMVLLAPLTPPRALAYTEVPPARRTGAPGENTCFTCHNGGLNDGSGSLAIVGVPETYTPGSVHTISVTLTRAGSTCWGFELTCLKTSDGSAAGTLANTTPLTYVQISSGKTYVSHTTLNTPSDGTFLGTVDGPVTWTFEWTAPPAQSGEVRFYAVGVAADASGDADGGDFVVTTSTPSAEEASSPVENTTWGKIKVRYR